MPTEIRMPRLIDSMTQGAVVAWRKREGDPVQAGEVIAEIEADKTTVDLESPAAGRSLKIVGAGWLGVGRGRCGAGDPGRGRAPGHDHVDEPAPRRPARRSVPTDIRPRLRRAPHRRTIAVPRTADTPRSSYPPGPEHGRAGRARSVVIRGSGPGGRVRTATYSGPWASKPLPTETSLVSPRHRRFSSLRTPPMLPSTKSPTRASAG